LNNDLFGNLLFFASFVTFLSEILIIMFQIFINLNLKKIHLINRTLN
jgi:hypothetical protein